MKPKLRSLSTHSGTGIHRRDFLKFCGAVAGALSLDATFIHFP